MLQGVRGRNSDNALILSQLGWEPTVKLHDGLKITYFWIKKQVRMHIVSVLSCTTVQQLAVERLHRCSIQTLPLDRTVTSVWLTVQVEAELKAGKDQSSFAKSTIVAASAPRELGSLRQADGAEGFENGTKDA